MDIFEKLARCSSAGEIKRMLAGCHVSLISLHREGVERSLLTSIVECGPDEIVADGGVTCLDIWRKEAEGLLKLMSQE